MNHYTNQIVEIIVGELNKKKVVTLSVLDVQALTPLTEVFVIAVASNVRQVKAMADAVEDALAEACRYPLHKEGYQTAQWILLDYGEVIIHLLDEEDARFYTLDRLWKDAEVVNY